MTTIVVAPNWLGDAVMALPALDALRRLHRDDRLVVAARSSVAGLFEIVPGVDAVVTLTARADGGVRRRLAEDTARVRTVGARRAVLLPNSLGSAFVVWRAGIPERCGYRRDLRGPLLTRPVARPRRRVHQVDYYRHLVSALGAGEGMREPRLDVGPQVRESGAVLLREAGWDGASPLLGIAPGAAFGGAKRWPPVRYAAVVAALVRAAAVTAVLVGSRADSGAAATVAQEAGKIEGNVAGRLIDLTGRTDLRQLAGVLAACGVLVTNDSGTMHLAAALGIPLVAVFGPTDERVTAPVPRTIGGRLRPASVMAGRAWCRPCGLRECPIDHRCMTRVSVDAIVGAVKDVL